MSSRTVRGLWEMKVRNFMVGKVRGILLAAAAVVAGASVTASAAPLVNLQINISENGTQLGSSGGIVTVQPGHTYTYSILASLAPVGTSNTGSGKSITSIAATDGINNLSFDLFSANRASGGPTPTDTITYSNAMSWENSGAGGTGGFQASAGGSSGTTSNTGTATGGAALTGIVPAHAIGTQSGGTTPDTLGTGTFTISNSFTGIGDFGARWTTGGAGLAKINGGKNVFISDATDAPPSTDPVVGYTGSMVQLQVPEPSTLALAGIGALGLLARRRVAVK